MPQWIHDRAQRLLDEGDLTERYGPEKGKQVAFAIATQQSHALGKSPKGYGTSEGKSEAKKKYDEPASYQKTASGFITEVAGVFSLKALALRVTGG